MSSGASVSVERGDGVLEVLRACVAPTIGAVTARLREQPGERHLRAWARRAAPPPRRRASTTLRSASAVFAYSVLPKASVSERALVGVPVARQAAAGQRAPRDDADALVAAQRQHLALLLAVEQVVGGSASTDEPRPAVLVGRVQRLRELPGVHRRRADVARLAGLHDVVSASSVSSIGVVVIPAVDLVEVDVVGAEPLQAGVDLARRWPCATGRAPFGPWRIGPWTLVAITTSSRRRSRAARGRRSPRSSRRSRRWRCRRS